MDKTWKATLVGVCGVCFGVVGCGFAFLVALGPIDLFDDTSEVDAGSFPLAAASALAGLAVVLGSLWLAARISGQSHRFRSALGGLGAGLLAVVVGSGSGGALGEAIFMAAPAIAVALTVRSTVPQTIGPRLGAVLAASLALFATSIGGTYYIIAAMILIAFAIPLADAAADQYRTATR